MGIRVDAQGEIRVDARGTAGARILAIGDVHLGRRPSRLPVEALAEHGLSPRDLGPAAALAGAVRWAIAERVHAVVLLGDVVEDEHHFLEAYPALRDAAKALVDARIELFAVVGNHDTEVLPRLAAEVPGVHLLGKKGTWESALLWRDGAPFARLLGWSFPAPKVRHSPLDNFPSAWREGRFDDGAPAGLATLGLLHCDVDASASVHAPVRRAALVELGLAFALGHVHKPGELAGPRPVGYLGSLSGLDPGEPGQHGPWLFEAHAGDWRARQIALAPLRYDRVAVEVGGARSKEDLEERWQRAIDRHLDTLDGDPARAVALRLELVGERTLDRAVLSDFVERERDRGPTIQGGRVWFAETVRDTTQPPLQLAQWAQNDDPVGLLARRALALGAPGAERDALLARARAHLSARLGAEHDVEALVDDELAEILLHEARRALEELVQQGAAT